ncbi:hypothetical protein BTR23_09840 [Alkalihalophilus pseudofirmus]|nr:hypothetical protein BTR23_09840 [Alkalihalophilus pseudofirmus]
MNTIQSEDLIVQKLFNDYYTVPSYQREYVWQQDQVNRLLEDILEAKGDFPRTDEGDYFIGSIVVCESKMQNEGSVLEVIDGQQRLTTMIVILCAIRDRITDINQQADISAINSFILNSSFDYMGNAVEKMKLSLQYEESDGILEKLGKRKDVSNVSTNSKSVNNIINAYQYTKEFLAQNYGDEEKAVREFFGYLINKVKVIRVQTISVAQALKIFETINDRGVGLNSMDLLKNLMFMHVKPQEFDKLKMKWKEIVQELEKRKEKPLRFLRYFIMGNYGVEEITEERIYDWFLNNEDKCGYKSDSFGFVELLTKNVKAYANYVSGKNPDGTDNRYLDNLRYFSGSARQHLILLLAARKLDNQLLEKLSRQIENLFFCYTITREPTKTFEKKFAKWSLDLIKVKDEEGLDQFLQKYIEDEKRKKKESFTYHLQMLTQQSIQQYRIRYILAKLSQSLDERAWGSTPVYTTLNTYIHKDIELEHILPRNPTTSVRDAFDKQDEYKVYVVKLGNLTLLEKSINSSISNGSYENKRVEYEKSNFVLTKALSKKPQVGVNTKINRAVSKLRTYDKWNSVSIEDRQQLLVELALHAWDMESAAVTTS